MLKVAKTGALAIADESQCASLPGTISMALDPAFVEDSVSLGDRQPVNRYLIDISSARPAASAAARHAADAGVARLKYADADDARIVAYVADNPTQAHAGNAFWKAFCARYPAYQSFQSVRARYLKVVAKFPKAKLDVLRKLYDRELRAADSARPSQVARGASLPRQGKAAGAPALSLPPTAGGGKDDGDESSGDGSSVSSVANAAPGSMLAAPGSMLAAHPKPAEHAAPLTLETAALLARKVSAGAHSAGPVHVHGPAANGLHAQISKGALDQDDFIVLAALADDHAPDLTSKIRALAAAKPAAGRRGPDAAATALARERSAYASSLTAETAPARAEAALSAALASHSAGNGAGQPAAAAAAAKPASQRAVTAKPAGRATKRAASEADSHEAEPAGKARKARQSVGSESASSSSAPAAKGKRPSAGAKRRAASNSDDESHTPAAKRPAPSSSDGDRKRQLLEWIAATQALFGVERSAVVSALKRANGVVSAARALLQKEHNTFSAADDKLLLLSNKPDKATRKAIERLQEKHGSAAILARYKVLTKERTKGDD